MKVWHFARGNRENRAASQPLQCMRAALADSLLQAYSMSTTPSMTETVEGVKRAQVAAFLMEAAAEGKRVGRDAVSIGESKRSLHMNGSTVAAEMAAAVAAVAAEAAAVLDDALPIMMDTAAVAATAPRERKTARASDDACITPRAQVKICSCS